MSIGRNDKCPCNSGKKYKHCHLKIEKLRKQMERDNLRKIPESERKQLQSYDREIIKHFFDSKGKKCLYSNCDRSPIRSHTFPRNMLEKQIAKKTNNGYSVFSSDIRNIISNLQDPKLHDEFFYEVNINTAGTMPLFCKEHDSQIFSPIETFKPIPTEKQYIFLYAYRFFLYHFSKEKYALIDNQNAIGSEKGVGKSLSSDTRNKRNSIYANATKIVNIKANTTNLDKLKIKFDQVMNHTLPSDAEINKHFTIYSYELTNDIHWCGAGSTNFSYDDTPSTDHLECSFGLIPRNGNFPAYFYCVVPNEENDYLKDKLLKLLNDKYDSYKNEEETASFENIIKYYIFDSSENIIISPDIIAELREKEICSFDKKGKLLKNSQYEWLLKANSLLSQVKGVQNEEVRNTVYNILEKIDLFKKTERLVLSNFHRPIF